MLANRMALVDKLAVDAQVFAISKRPIHTSLHLMYYIVERIGTESDMRGALINLYQSKVFNKVEHQ